MTTPAVNYHSPRYVADPDEPRWLCPCRCGKLLDRDGWLALVGREPPTTRRRPQAWMKAKP